MFPIGTVVRLPETGPAFTALQSLGLGCCQLVSWEPHLWSLGRAREVRQQIRESGIEVTAFWAGWEGPRIWNLLEGPHTLGLVPAAYRFTRAENLKSAGLFASELGVPAVITHLGFIPENPADTLFHELVTVVRDIAEHYQRLGLEFWFETGQETPVTMLRLIESVGTGNLAVNLDPANLILYGKGNPVDAIDVLGGYVRNVHAKDAFYPTDPMKLGREVKVGTGRVNFPVLARRLKEEGFSGAYIIEREITGEEQIRDIKATIAYLQELLAQV